MEVTLNSTKSSSNQVIKKAVTPIKVEMVEMTKAFRACCLHLLVVYQRLNYSKIFVRETSSAKELKQGLFYYASDFFIYSL